MLNASGDYTRRLLRRMDAGELLLVRVAEALQRARIDNPSLVRDRLEVQRILHELDQHEVVAGVEAFGSEVGPPHVPFAQLRGAARDEVVDALLRLDALVEVLVPGENDIDAVLEKERLEQHPQLHIGSVRAARRVEWVMEEADLPVGSAGRQLLLEPVQLGLVHVVAIEGEEPDAKLWPERVEPLAVHVEALVEPLVRV